MLLSGRQILQRNKLTLLAEWVSKIDDHSQRRQKANNCNDKVIYECKLMNNKNHAPSDRPWEKFKNVMF